MSALTFSQTWERARRRREAPAWSYEQSTRPRQVKPCPLDPTRAEAHPAQLYELALLDLDDETFKRARPDTARELEADKPALTGVTWIDEQEAARYGPRG